MAALLALDAPAVAELCAEVSAQAPVVGLVCFADVVEAADVRAVLEPRRPAGAPASCDGVEVPW